MKIINVIYKNIFFLLLVPSIFAQNAAKLQMETLIQRWDNRDGSQFIEIGFELSKFFVENDSIFLREMSKNKNTFSSWLDKLQFSSFTAYEAGDDKIEHILYTAFYNKLKELMLERAKIWINHSEYQYMVNEIIIKLNSINVRFVE